MDGQTAPSDPDAAARVVTSFRIARAIDDFVPLNKWSGEHLLFLAEEGRFEGPDLGLLDSLISLAEAHVELGADVSVERHRLSRISGPLLAGDLAAALKELRSNRKR